MKTSAHNNRHPDHQASILPRLLIAACFLTGCFFTLRALTPHRIPVMSQAAAEPRHTAEAETATGDRSIPLPSAAQPRYVTRNIEDLKPGDLVLARDEYGTAVGLKPVKEVYRRISNHLRHLSFESSDGTQQTLSTTDEHPFWSVTADDFIEAGSLIVGHSVAGPNGETQTLVSSNREEFPEGVRVFNFQVTDYHTYFVAASADKPVMLVHNADYARTGTGPFGYPTGTIDHASIHTGRHIAENLTEQLVMAEAKAGAGVLAVAADKIGDPRFAGGNWAKFHHSHELPGGGTSVVHYMKNLFNGQMVDFKFK